MTLSTRTSVNQLSFTLLILLRTLREVLISRNGEAYDVAVHYTHPTIDDIHTTAWQHERNGRQQLTLAEQRVVNRGWLQRQRLVTVS